MSYRKRFSYKSNIFPEIFHVTIHSKEKHMFINEDDFDDVIKQEWGKDGSTVVYDGITNIKEWNKTPVKILWILKEGNEHTHEDRDHREFHTCVTWYSGWKSTYKNIILPTYGILNNIPYENLPSLSNNAKVGGEYVLDIIALINVNKNGGSSQASSSIIKNNYTKHKDTLLQQIEKIEPNIIINCSRVKRLFDDIVKQYKLEKKLYDPRPTPNYVVNYAQNDSKLIIDYWHPGAHLSSKNYYKMILDIYDIWKKSYK